MIRYGFHLGLVDGFSSRRVESGSSRHHPVFSRLGAPVTGAGFDAAGIDGLLGFTTREIRLRIEGALARQVLPLFARVGIIHNDQLRVRVLLQTQSYVIE